MFKEVTGAGGKTIKFKERGLMAVSNNIEVKHGSTRAIEASWDWENGHRIIWLNLESPVPIRNVILGVVIEAHHDGQQDCCEC